MASRDTDSEGDAEALENDALETDLYLLREKLREQPRG